METWETWMKKSIFDCPTGGQSLFLNLDMRVMFSALTSQNHLWQQAILMKRHHCISGLVEKKGYPSFNTEMTSFMSDNLIIHSLSMFADAIDDMMNIPI
jgi:hypothetical protein